MQFVNFYILYSKTGVMYTEIPTYQNITISPKIQCFVEKSFDNVYVPFNFEKINKSIYYFEKVLNLKTTNYSKKEGIY